jgi:ABC-type uncharacterized transport system permease subunit
VSINDNLFVIITASALYYGTPLFLAALGELVTERSGVLNLGVEGMMLMGAVTAAWVSIHAPGPGGVVLALAVLAAMAAAGLTAAIHAFLVITLRVNQTVSGLAITIFAGSAGLSSYLANSWNVAQNPVPNQFLKLDVFGLAKMPILGPTLFNQTVLTYLSWALAVLVSWYLFHTRAGLHLRAVGESPESADAMGVNVVGYRYVHTIIGGTFAGIAGACFSLIPTWVDGLTGGKGWIAIALVIFGFWRPGLTLIGAYLFGGFSSLSLTLQTRGVNVAPQILDSLPYVMTIVFLTIL